MKMTDEEFCKVLEGAVAGRHEDLETLLQLYRPLIDKYSFWGGCIDEDLRQYLLIHIALNITKFIL